MKRERGYLPRFGIDVILFLKSIKTLLLIVLLLIQGCGGGGGSGGGADDASVIADAGPDLAANEQTLVTLQGTGSTGNIKSYSWNQIGGPLVSLNNAGTAIANYMAPAVVKQEVLVFRLTVSGNNGATSSDEATHRISPVNSPPVADAGPDQFVPGQTIVTLDGNQSADGDGFIQSFSWTQTGGTEVDLTNSNTATPSFTAPAATEVLTFELIVTDNEGDTASDEVAVSVAEMLFSDDFSNGDQNGWTINVVDDSNNTSDWTVNGGGYLLQQNFLEDTDNGGTPFVESYHRGSYSFPNSGQDWDDYRFSVDVTPLPDGNGQSEGNDIGIMFRLQGNDNYYRLTLNARYGYTRLEKKVNGIFSTLAVDGRGYEEGEDLNIIVETNGSLIRIYVDDEPLFSTVDSDIASGTIALYCQDRVMFDNVIVTENSPAPAIVISESVAFSVATTVDAADPNTLDVAAITANVPIDGAVDFFLDGIPCELSSEPIPGLYRSVCLNVPQGEHTLVAVLLDKAGSALARDTNFSVGIQGNYFVAVGNSITNGKGDNYSKDNVSQDGRINAIQGYEANLNNLLTSTLLYPHVVFNEGIGGDESEQAANERIDSILERHPGANGVLILLGTNDSSGGGITTSEYRNNMQTLINKVTPGKEAWVALIPPTFNDDGTPNSGRNSIIQDYNNVITAQLSGIQVGPNFYDYFLGSGNNRSSLFADTLHPNGLGYAVMASLWHNVLVGAADPFQFTFIVLDNLTPLKYKQNLLEVGDEYYIDESFTLTDIPAVLDEGIWVMTANADRFNTSAAFLSFEVNRRVTVYVAYDSVASPPTWLTNDFTNTGLQIGTTNGSLNLYSREYDGASPITLDGNRAGNGTGSRNYIVVVVEN